MDLTQNLLIFTKISRQFAIKLTLIKEELYELHQVNPQEVKIGDRSLLRDNILKSEFDEEHYLYDLYLNEEEIINIMSQPFIQLYEAFLKQEYTDQQTQQLIKLAKKEILIGDEELCLRSLADIVLPFCYEWRVMGGDELTSESAITINKCSSLLSCHTIDNTLQAVILQCCSRCLTYPLIRNFSLFEKVSQNYLHYFKAFQEMKTLINENGRKFILKVLLDIKKLFSSSEPRYLLNTLYIDSFCLFIQRVSEDKFATFKELLLAAQIAKADIIFNLQEVEELAVEDIKEQAGNVL